MSNYDGKIELPQMYNNQGEEQYLSSDKSDTYLWLAEENTKQAKEIKRLQEQLKEANAIIKDMRPFIQGSMKRKTFTRILHYEDKWGVK